MTPTSSPGAAGVEELIGLLIRMQTLIESNDAYQGVHGYPQPMPIEERLASRNRGIARLKELVDEALAVALRGSP